MSHFRLLSNNAITADIVFLTRVSRRENASELDIIQLCYHQSRLKTIAEKHTQSRENPTKANRVLQVTGASNFSWCEARRKCYYLIKPQCDTRNVSFANFSQSFRANRNQVLNYKMKVLLKGNRCGLCGKLNDPVEERITLFWFGLPLQIPNTQILFVQSCILYKWVLYRK